MRTRNIKNAASIIEEGKYYINNPSDYKGAWNKVFNNDNEIHLEIGMGKGEFIVESAKENPNINYIGIEKFDSILLRAIQKSNELELPNLRLIKLDAENIENIFDHEIDVLYLNFSDPWPKDRHAKRRLTSNNFLKLYDNIFKNNKKIIQKTDNDKLFDYSVESLKNYGYKIEYITRDLHKENIPNIKTEYEKKFSSLNTKINMLVSTKD